MDAHDLFIRHRLYAQRIHIAQLRFFRKRQSGERFRGRDRVGIQPRELILVQRRSEIEDPVQLCADERQLCFVDFHFHVLL